MKKCAFFLLLMGIFPKSVLAINEHSEHNNPITDAAIEHVSKASNLVLEDCNPVFADHLNQLHSDFIYSDEVYFLESDNDFWGNLYYNTGEFYAGYKMDKCQSIAAKIMQQSYKKAVASKNEVLIRDVSLALAEIEN